MGRVSPARAGDISGLGWRTRDAGERATVLAGEHDATDVVVLRFPSIQAAHGWHDSPEYQALIPLREEGADVMLISFEESSD